jgi:hypothetical protein
MGSCTFSISMPQIRKILRFPRIISFSRPITVIDLIAEMDHEYFELCKKNDSLDTTFMDSKIRTFLQLLWNPNTGEFYDDIGIEGRIEGVQGESFPIEKQWDFVIPDNSRIILIPDAGC